MERYAWKARILDGMKAEYVRRHDEIWPEMKELLTEAGIQNYSIWLTGNELFGYYECIDGITHAAKTQAGSEVVARWNAYMKDVMAMELDPDTGAQPKLEQVFMFPAE
jgi:L-rhamnose mutarotase